LRPHAGNESKRFLPARFGVLTYRILHISGTLALTLARACHLRHLFNHVTFSLCREICRLISRQIPFTRQTLTSTLCQWK
jgi:hypothetical protein